MLPADRMIESQCVRARHDGGCWTGWVVLRQNSYSLLLGASNLHVAAPHHSIAGVGALAALLSTHHPLKRLVVTGRCVPQAALTRLQAAAAARPGLVLNILWNGRNGMPPTAPAHALGRY